MGKTAKSKCYLGKTGAFKTYTGAHNTELAYDLGVYQVSPTGYFCQKRSVRITREHGQTRRVITCQETHPYIAAKHLLRFTFNSAFL